MKKTTVFPLLVMGVNSLVIQTVLLREFLFSFLGNELTVGIILGNWLLLEAAGSGILGPRALRSRYRSAVFAGCAVFIAFAFPGLVFTLRSIRSITGIVPGQTLGPVLLIAVSLLVTAPLALADGIQFSLGRTMVRDARKVYMLEACGALAGGFIMLGIFASGMSTWVILLLTGLLNLAGAASSPVTRQSHVRTAVAAAVIGAAGTAGLFWGNGLEQAVFRLQWPGFSVQDHRAGRYGNITLLEREGQYTVIRNGTPLITGPDADIADMEETGHLPLLSHPAPRSVLVAGNGNVPLLREIVKHHPERLDLVSADPLPAAVMASAGIYARMPETVTRITADPRQYIRTTDRRYDVVILDLPAPSSLLLNRLYTREFFRQVRRILKPGGMFSCRMTGSSGYFGTRLLEIHRTLHATLADVFGTVTVLPDERVLYLAGASPFTEDLTAERFVRSGVITRFLNINRIAYRFNPVRQEKFLRDLSVPGISLNRDMVPVLVRQTAAFWFDRTGFPVSGRVLPALLVILAATGAILILRRGNRGLSGRVAATGFGSMSLQLVLMLGWQIRAGSLYLNIALLMAAFMAGLALGALLPDRFPDGTVRHEAAIGPSLICLAVLTGLSIRFSGPVLLFPVLSLATGIITGLQYAVAAARDDSAAGTLYAADLLGAWAACMTVPLFILPRFGALAVLGLVVLVKGIPVTISCFRKKQTRPSSFDSRSG